jgi:3-isopropylmalate/(R)-2-methylmalate dehydratase small subunit
MQPFDSLEADVCPLALSNIDTDQLIPARFMKSPRSEGYGRFLLHDLRFDEAGEPRPEFPLNDPRHAAAGIVIARRNFGCGSSREAAVYALVDYGIRCVIAPSFGDIFAANAVNNGLLPARIEEAAAERLLARLAGGGRLRIDLAAATATVGDEVIPFDIDPVWRLKLLNGWDDIDMTRSYADAIDAFVAIDRRSRPWMAPTRKIN